MSGPRTSTAARCAVAVLAVASLTGCATVQELADRVPSPPGPAVTDWVPTPTPDATDTGLGNLSPDGFAVAQRMAVRIRNVGCADASQVAMDIGSGFAIDARTLITNRHVVADSAELQVSTYDGRDVGVDSAATASLADLAVVRTAQDLPDHPELADADPVLGDPVTVVGYPEGGVLTVTSGKVIGTTTDPLNQSLNEVLVTDAEVEPGSSGSAVLDSDGRVIGVVYAKNAADQSFIVPVSTLRHLLDDDSAFTAVPGCD